MSDKPVLTRESILSRKELKRETVDVPEWGGPVIVSELTASERDAFEASCVKRKGKSNYETNLANLRAKLIVQAVRNEDGSRTFGDGDADAVGALSASAINRLFAVASRLSGMSEDDVEELAGN